MTTLYVFGSCNGVICLFETFPNLTHNITLWNPSIRKFLKIPSFCSVYSSYKVVAGFGFDSVSNDCKFVRIVYVQRREAVEGHRRRPIDVEFYLLNAGSWKTISFTLSPFLSPYHKRNQV